MIMAMTMDTSFDQRLGLWTAHVGHVLKTKPAFLCMRLSSLLDRFSFIIYGYLAEKVS